MQKNFTLFALICTLIFSACSTVEDALAPEENDGQLSDATGSPILVELTDSDWFMTDCGNASTEITVDGLSACDYLNRLSFSSTTVYVRHYNEHTLTAHHICYIDAEDRLLVSKVNCGHAYWSQMFEWEVIAHGEESLVIRVTAPEIDPAYTADFEYVKIG